MSTTPSLYIVDEHSARGGRLSTVLSFIHEAHQVLSYEQLINILSSDEPAVVMLGALENQQHAALLQRYPATAFLLAPMLPRLRRCWPI